jgi:hypothetical protein
LRVLATSFLRFRHHTQWDNTVGRTPLEESSARHRDLYLTNTQHSQQKNTHAPGGIRIRNPSRRAAADPRLRPLGHWDQLNTSNMIKKIKNGILIFQITFNHLKPNNCYTHPWFWQSKAMFFRHKRNILQDNQNPGSFFINDKQWFVLLFSGRYVVDLYIV